MKNLPFLLLLASPLLPGFSQNPTGPQLLEKSIRYHDPKGAWAKGKFEFSLTETRPEAADRKTVLFLDNKANSFRMEQQRNGNRIVREIKNGVCSFLLNGSSNVPQEDLEKHRLTCDQTTTIRNYYTYLWGLPMKLNDPGTFIQDKVEPEEFQGQKCLKMKVTYNEEVGHDTWYFYFHPSTYALVGYRFYHDETKNDGEFIPLEGEAVVNGVRFPKKRSWYANEDGKYLGADMLER